MSDPEIKNDIAEESLHRLKKFSIASFLTIIVRFGIRIVKNVIFTRLLGPAERGIFGLLTTIPDLIISLGNVGFGIGCEYLIAKKKYDLGKILGNTLLMTVILGAGLIGVGYGVFSFKGLLKGDDSILIGFAPLVLFMIPFILLHRFSEDLLAASQEIHFLNTVRLFVSLLPGVFLLALWLFTGQTLKSAMYAWALSTLVVTIWSIFKLAALCNFKIQISLPYIMESFAFGGRGLIGIFAGILVRKVDYLFVSSMLGATELGYYAVSVSVAEILISLQSAISTPFMSIRYGLEKQDASLVTPTAIRHTVLINGVLALGVMAGGKLLIFILFGKSFLPAYSAVLILLPGVIALSVHDLIKYDYYSHNLPEVVSMAAIWSLICNIILNFVLIPAYGINGAALSSSISYSLATIILLARFHATTGIPYMEILIIKKSELMSIARKLQIAS